MKILVAEDDRDSRDLLALMLEQDGHMVIRAENGREAWEIFQSEKESFPLLISDWLMPDVDGLELCRRIRAANRSPYTYIILLTALKGKANYLGAIKAGADDFISKPYDPDEVKARLTVADRIMHLQERVSRLEGILPTCMYCKRIREEERWVGIEQYVAARSEASFSHGVCPDCYQEYVRPEMNRLK
jgi:phosphoserine phosphatase RsbU/P